MPKKPQEPELSCREAGRRGGRRTSERHGPEHYHRMGQKGAQRVKELIARGRELEKEERGE